MSENADMLDVSAEQAAAVVGVGDMLRTTREHHGLSLVDVAQALKLTQRQVQALEDERFDALPGAAFARGFLRNYARLLGLDPEPLIQSLAQTSGVAAPAELAPISNAQGTLPNGDGALRPSALPMALIAALLMLAVVGGWYFDWFQTTEDPATGAAVADTPVAPAALTPVVPPPDSAPLVIPDDAPTAQVAPTTAPTALEAVAVPSMPGAPAPVVPSAPQSDAATPVAAAVVPVPAPAAPKPEVAAPVEPVKSSRLVFRFSKESWVEVRDASGEIIFSRTNRAGSVQEVSGKPPYRLVVGNAKSVELEYGGKPVDLAPHTNVSVARLTLE
ncbi:RodZ domain-containing protein [Denitromonas halophila]|nr:RodZ domain-containing protein [Denitromonas halophila]